MMRAFERPRACLVDPARLASKWPGHGRCLALRAGRASVLEVFLDVHFIGADSEEDTRPLLGFLLVRVVHLSRAFYHTRYEITFIER